MAYFFLGFAFLAGHFCFVEEDEDSTLLVAAGVVWLDSTLLLDSVEVLATVSMEACCPGDLALDSYGAGGQKIHT